MAGRHDLLGFDQKAVGIAVVKNLSDFLYVSRDLPFLPEFFSGAGIEMGQAGFHGFSDRLPVHPGHHQDFSAFHILNNGGDQTIWIEFQL